MKVLIVGGGGREHAIAWKLAQNKKIDKMYCAPGNAGIAQIAECVPIKATDVQAICDFAEKEKIDLTVVAPDDPLALGLVDMLEARNLRAFGPKKNAAIIEASKVFSKELMKKYSIPTARYEVFTDSTAAIEYLEKGPFPAVIKAEGLALGKGVIIAENFEDAKSAVIEMMENKAFGEAGNRVVIEEYLTGRELSVLAFTDGVSLSPMVSAQDHKRALDGDKGLNTGGMGAYAPSPIYDAKMQKACMEKIFLPTMRAMNAEGRTFRGVLYFGLMATKDGVKVIEYNCRFGDPETQAVLMLLESDLLEIFEAIIDTRLADIDIKWSRGAAACVIAASGGYPGKYEKGSEITFSGEMEDAVVFHAGTSMENGKLVTSGGRVLGVSAKAGTLEDAIKKAYRELKKVHFKDMHYRTDIGKKGLNKQ